MSVYDGETTIDPDCLQEAALYCALWLLLSRLPPGVVSRGSGGLCVVSALITFPCVYWWSYTLILFLAESSPRYIVSLCIGGAPCCV